GTRAPAHGESGLKSPFRGDRRTGYDVWRAGGGAGPMKRWSSLFLALIVALFFALLGVYYLLPDVYHPLTSDTYLHSAPQIKHAAVFLALSVLALILGGILRPTAKA